jgi:hypothetical protein
MVLYWFTFITDFLSLVTLIGCDRLFQISTYAPFMIILPLDSKLYEVNKIKKKSFIVYDALLNNQESSVASFLT